MLELTTGTAEVIRNLVEQADLPEGGGVRVQLGKAAENGAAPEQAVIVGDSHVDVRTGRNAGMWTVAVSYGFAPHTLEGEPADVTVDHPEELTTVFRG